MTDGPVPVLSFENVGVEYRIKGHPCQVLHDVTFKIAPGSAYGLVGESGCGKSTAAFAALRYLPRNGFVNRGRILIGGRSLGDLGEADLREVRRSTIAMVYQDPSRSLNPSLPVGRQLQEVFELARVPRAEWRGRCLDILARVRISDPASVMGRYPHQLSGGMQQRVSIAMAIASDPKLLIMDEPTTGLDSTVEAEVLDLVDQLRQELQTAILFISHDLGVVARMCDRVGVLYAGRLVEEAATQDLFNTPQHPYTAGLLRCLPKWGRSKHVAPLATIPGFLPSLGATIDGCPFADRCPVVEDRCRCSDPAFRDIGGRSVKCHFAEKVALTEAGPDGAGLLPQAPAPDRQARDEPPLLEIRRLNKTFGSARLPVRAVRDVTLTLRRGETLGLVGESGSGKTTLARCVLGLANPDPGSEIRLGATPLGGLMARRSREQIKSLQIVFQNPDAALNRSHSVRRLIGRTLRCLVGLTGKEREQRVQDLARSVRLSERHLAVLPRQLSGGLKQRVAIARAFAGDPKIVICDEPTSALDVSVQAAILNLLAELQARKRVSYILISHDLGVVRYLSDKIAVMYLGQIMEVGPAAAVFAGPHHPYTAVLLSSAPRMDGRSTGRVKLAGEVPSTTDLPAGCVFHTRCPSAIPGLCDRKAPPVTEIAEGHHLRCHLKTADLPKLATA